MRAAGDFSRVRDTNTVASLFNAGPENVRTPTLTQQPPQPQPQCTLRAAQYGPSHAALQSWKKSGIPTSQTMQRSTFGRSTQRSEGMGGMIYVDERDINPAAPSNTMRLTNPITWEGEEEPARPNYHAPPPPPPAPPPAQTFSSAQQSNKTWAELMRTRPGQAISAAQCLLMVRGPASLR